MKSNLRGQKSPRIEGTNANLARFGLPLTAEYDDFVETPEGRKPIRVQWFERARFEYHPHNPPRYQVLFGLLGREVRH